MPAKHIQHLPLIALLMVAFTATLHATDKPLAAPATDDPIFSTEEILDESTLDIQILQDWHVDEVTGTTRQKLIEINVAQWWPGQDYRIPVRLIVPLEGKAKGFSITGANPYETLMKDSQLTDFQAKLLTGGVGIVKTHVKALRQIPGKKGLEQKMGRVFLEDLNPRYTTIWIWSMTLMRATTAAYAEVDYFEKGKVVGSGGSKNGLSPAVALINDERFTATCSNVAFAWASPTRKGDRGELQKVQAANKIFFEAAKAGEFELETERAQWYQRVMVGSRPNMEMMAQKAGIPIDELHDRTDRFMTSVCVTENWDRLMERGVDILFQPGTHDYVAYDVLWGAQNHPQLPVYYEPNGGHSQTPHVATTKDEQNKESFIWNHFFGGEPLLSPPTSSHEVIGDKLKIHVRFENGPQAESGRIWWMYDRAPAGSAPFFHERIPEDQWADMKRDPKTSSWIATIPLQEGASRIDFFSNHGKVVNGYQQYLSSPYTQVELKAEDAVLKKTLEGINDRFENVDVQLLKWPDELHKKLGNLKKIAFMAFPTKQAAGKLPLLISLHGAGGRKMSLQEQLTRSAEVKGLGLAELAGKELVLLEPNTAAMWEVDSLNTMLDYVLENHPEIDTNRIYVMGHSMGGYGSWAWINKSADRFAAASPSGIGIGDSGDVERLVNLPIWGMVGGDDKKDRVAGIKRMVERLRAAGNKQVKYTEFPGANHAAANAAVFSSVDLVNWMLGFSRGADKTENGFSFSKRESELDILLDGKPLATYVWRDPKTTRPYFKQIKAAGGEVQLTRNHPPQEGDFDDHQTYHPGIWWGFGDVGGNDYWRMKARIIGGQFTQAPTADGSSASFEVSNKFLTNQGDETFCEQNCRYTFLRREHGVLMICESALVRDASDFWLGDQEEMGLALRVATSLTTKKGGTIRDSEGRTDLKQVRTNQSDWCDYSGAIVDKSGAKKYAGLMLMNDPKNFRKPWWHAVDTGLLVANPLGESELTGNGKKRENVLVKKGEPFRLRFGCLIHMDNSAAEFDAKNAYADFLSVVE